MESIGKVVSKNDMSRGIKELVDFLLIYNELELKYCKNNGRNQ